MTDRTIPLDNDLPTLEISRREGERIWLDLGAGWGIWVGVREIRSNKVRLLIQAPRDIKILREELLTPR